MNKFVSPRHFILGAALAGAFALPAQAQQSSLTPQLKGKPNAQMNAVLDELKTLKPKPIEKLKPSVARAQPLPSDAVASIMKKRGLQPTAVKSIEAKSIPGPGGKGQVNVQVYTPNGAPSGPLPVVVYFHGGGFVIASIADYDGSCRAIADMTKAMVVAVSYSYAPEKKLPTQHEQSYAVTQYLLKNAAAWGGDPNKVAVMGESAGGNLALDMCLMAKMRGGKMPVAQILVYPFVQGKKLASHKAYYNAKPLNTPMVDWFLKYALPSKKFGNTALASPVYTRNSYFKGLPPATVIAAEIDPLQTEGQLLTTKLRRNGVQTEYRLYKGVTHEFFGMGAVVNEAKNAEMFAASRLKAAFGT